MKSIIFTLFGVFLFSFLYSQPSIDYKPKSLIKALQKDGISNFSNVKEFAVNDSIIENPLINGKFFQIEDISNCRYKYIYIGRVNSCRAGGCSIENNKETNGNSEYFDYFILYDENKTVKVVKVFNYQATHGQEITSNGWLKQFSGYSGNESLQVNKNIDAISGATISVYAITLDVELKTEILTSML